MKIIAAPDKFKGSLSSFEVCQAIREGINRMNKEIEISGFPMADGGDGFAAVMKYYLKTNTIVCGSVDPLGRPIQVGYEWDDKNQVAIIEMAVASGLVLLNPKERNPLLTSSIGTGLMIRHAVEKGANHIVLGLGGSATNDAGTGILSALGFRFYNAKNESLQGCGQSLAEIKRIERPESLPAVRFGIACDVQNVLYGEEGAAFIFAPQKGATAEDVKLLDIGLRNIARVLEQETGRSISAIPGTGAAGGIAAGLMSFFDVEMQKGIELIIGASGIKKQLVDADLLITGEGRIDSQSGTGKVVGYLSSLAAQFGVPCSAICGELDLDGAGIQKLGLRKVIALLDQVASRDEAMKNTRELLVKNAATLLADL